MIIFWCSKKEDEKRTKTHVREEKETMIIRVSQYNNIDDTVLSSALIILTILVPFIVFIYFRLNIYNGRSRLLLFGVCADPGGKRGRPYCCKLRLVSLCLPGEHWGRRACKRASRKATRVALYDSFFEACVCL